VRVAVVANPVRDPDGSAVAAVRASCRARGWPDPTVALTTIGEAGHAQGRAAVDTGVDLVVVIGGDGTVREVAMGLAGSGAPLGIVPRGTANLYARNLRIPIGSVSRAVEIALGGDALDADLGRARWRRSDGSVGAGAFVVLAGIGHDARTVALVRPVLKRHILWLAYFVPALMTLQGHLLPMRVRRDGGPAEEQPLWCLLAGNVGRIPLGIEVLPGARLDDGLLHLAAVGPKHLIGWVPIALKGLLRWPGHVPGLAYSVARSVQVETEAPLTIHLDGDEHVGVVWLEATIDPGALRVQLPRL
jgi:diacylglycerol kinase family enzyme